MGMRTMHFMQYSFLQFKDGCNHSKSAVGKGPWLQQQAIKMWVGIHQPKINIAKCKMWTSFSCSMEMLQRGKKQLVNKTKLKNTQHNWILSYINRGLLGIKCKLKKMLINGMQWKNSQGIILSAFGINLSLTSRTYTQNKQFSDWIDSLAWAFEYIGNAVENLK